jgi:hypothetical protein
MGASPVHARDLPRLWKGIIIQRRLSVLRIAVLLFRAFLVSSKEQFHGRE